MELSRRVRALKPSSTVAVMNKAKALLAQGVPVLNFSAGEPDFDSPEPAKAAAIAALKANQTKYIAAAGDQPTRELLAKILTERNKIPNCGPEQVVVTTGVKMALYLTYQALFDPPAAGEAPQELLLPVPAWVSFAPMAELAGAKVVELPTDAAGGFKITPAQLRAAITPRSRVLMLNSPSNPCSTMYTPDELRALAAVVEEAAKTTAPGLCVVSDELYQHIVFGSVPFMSIGSVPGVAERTITINGPGKSFAMTGWRLGWLSGSGAFGKQVCDAVSKLLGQTTTCVPAFTLAGMRTALTECGPDLERMRQAFAKRAELIHGLLSAIPGITVAKPIGAFYVFPDIAPHLGKTSPGGKKVGTPAEFAAALLEERQMAVVPGEDFGGVGRHSIRMSFACSEDQIREGCKRLGEFCAGLR
jgi:aspartate aminotransferase